MFKKIKYKKQLIKETNDNTFINNINEINKIIKNIEPNNTSKQKEKINNHYNKIEKTYLNKNNHQIKFLQQKKIAINYHLYLLNKYYEELITKKSIK